MRRVSLHALVVVLFVALSAWLGGCAAGGSGEGPEAGFGMPDTGSGGDGDDGSALPDAGAERSDGGHQHRDGGGLDAAPDGEGGKGGPFTIGGTVSGLVGGGLVLQDNGSDNLSITTNGAFAFAVPVAAGGAYDVTAFIQPTSPAQTCTVSGGAGTVGTSDVTSIVVSCALETYTVGGTISGLSGTVVLQDNGGDDLTVTADGSFTFATPLPTGAAYAVTVLTQPALPSQTCLVATGSGTVGGAPVTTVVVTCTTNTFTVGGMVSGLAGSGLVLQDNGGDNLTITGSGPFTFATPVASGSSYLVTVLAQPTSPWQTCAITAGGGTVTSGPVTSVAVVCTTSSFTIGGTLAGLASGDSVVLQDNLTDSLKLTANGAFTFATSVSSGATYSASVLTQPASPAQTCTITMGAGTVGGTGVTSIAVTCTLNAGCGRFASGYTGAWTTVAANPFPTGMGLSDYVPGGAPYTLYLNSGTSFDEYSSAIDSYGTLSAAPMAMATYGTTAWSGTALWSITSGDVLRYDLTTGAWTTPATGLTTSPNSQTAADDSGNLWTFSGLAQLAEYAIATGKTTYHALASAVPGASPRIAFDSCTGLLYMTGSSTVLAYSYDPASKTQIALASLPGGNLFEEGFCGDRSGHIFASTATEATYQYTIATDTWSAMPSVAVAASAACGVGADGYLYATDPSVSTKMFRIPLN